MYFNRQTPCLRKTAALWIMRFVEFERFFFCSTHQEMRFLFWVHAGANMLPDALPRRHATETSAPLCPHLGEEEYSHGKMQQLWDQAQFKNTALRVLVQPGWGARWIFDISMFSCAALNSAFFKRGKGQLQFQLHVPCCSPRRLVENNHSRSI